ncbi:very short patch repair endonuclease [Vibrio quintilis]|uniref:Very short patch repair protein n=1 Tax=Vibrio quintilis TaxID=1117707 RepID=A0A1M7YSH7_9VIBR|nr:DNA mismatch endonuclease Vsr [Vibrio quintilis]SHO55577.1 Very short patch repair protein [Vibrio quintilis]
MQAINTFGEVFVDVHDKATRSKNMKAIKNRDTKPEVKIRSLLHRNGFRFRIAPKTLPGKPDIWMKKWNTAIFIHGCFWHMHDCDFFHLPATRTEFWREKLGGNKLRDQKHVEALKAQGIRVLVIWECALRGKGKLSEAMLLILIKTWLLSGQKSGVIGSDGLRVD